MARSKGDVDMLKKFILEQSQNDEYLPKYQKIIDGITAAIESDTLSEGSALPSVRDMCRDYSFSRDTVSKAYQELKSRGIVNASPRKGYYVTQHNKFGAAAKKVIAPRDFKIGRQTYDTLGIIVPDIRRNVFPSMVEGFSAGSDENQLNVAVYHSEYDIRKQGDIILQIIYRGIGGIAIVPTISHPTPAYQIDVLQQHGIPVVYCLRAVEGVKAPLICFNWHNAGEIVGRKFVQAGHKRIGYVAASKYCISQAYETSLRATLESYDITLRPDMVFYGPPEDSGLEEGEVDNLKQQAILDMLSRPDRPTAIFCNDGMAEMLIYITAQKLGLSIPEDLSLVRFGKEPHDCIVAKCLASIFVDNYQIGITASKLLWEMREGKRAIDSDEIIEMPLRFDDGQTLGAAPSK